MTDTFLPSDRRSTRGRTLRYFPTGERDESRGVIASALALTALTVGLGAGGAAAGAAINARAAGKASKRQVGAANYAADQEMAATREAERYARQQQQQQWVEAEAARKANYDQWAARQRALNAFRQQHGFPPTEIPPYVPSRDPGFLTDPPSAPPPPPASRLPKAMPDDGGPAFPDDPAFPAAGAPGPAPAPQPWTPPTPESWRERTPQDPRQPPPMGAVEAYLPSQRTGYQGYAGIRAQSIGDYLRPRR